MFVLRQNGKICSGFNLSQFEGQEEVADDSAEVTTFLQELADPPGPHIEAARRALVLRRVKALAESPDLEDQVAALKLRLELQGD
jgi:hypothetical protein